MFREALAAILFIFIFSFWVTLMFGKFDDNKFKNNIGKRVVIQVDTLTLIDYNYFGAHYILSNGNTIYSAYADSLISRSK